MTITKTTDGTNITLALSGRLDATNAPKLEQELLTELESGSYVRLDCEELAFISSAGLQVLLKGIKISKSKNTAFCMVNVSDIIKEVLEMTGFSGILNIL